MGGDFFSKRTRHLIPITGNKPIIYHLLKSLDNTSGIVKKVIVIDEKIDKFEKIKRCEDSYKELFGPRINADIILVGQNPLTKVGTLNAVQCVLEESQDIEFPIMVVYGDCLIESKFLERLVQEFDKLSHGPNIVWGLIKRRDNSGDVLIDRKAETVLNSSINNENIVDILEYRVDNLDNVLLDTGIMIIAREAWDKIENLVNKIHRPSSNGIFSFTSIFRQALILSEMSEKDLGDFNINIIGVVDSEETWYDANLPWEILDLIPERISKFCTFTKEDGSITVSPGKEMVMKNGAKILGPSYIGKDAVISDYSIIDSSYLGRNCIIGKSVFISKSSIDNFVSIGDGSNIHNSIIMKNTKIYYQASIVRSIIGDEVMIGVGVRAPCKRMKDVFTGSVDRKDVIFFSDNSIEKAEDFGCVIGDYCQIGSNVIIHPGRKIGKYSKIGAGCQVYKNIPPYYNLEKSNGR